MGTILDTDRPHEALGPDKKNPDYMAQDGRLYAWSEGNCWYEYAWWLYAPADTNRREHVENLLRERPFPKDEVHRIPHHSYAALHVRSTA